MKYIFTFSHLIACLGLVQTLSILSDDETCSTASDITLCPYLEFLYVGVFGMCVFAESGADVGEYLTCSSKQFENSDIPANIIADIFSGFNITKNLCVDPKKSVSKMIEDNHCTQMEALNVIVNQLVAIGTL